MTLKESIHQVLRKQLTLRIDEIQNILEDLHLSRTAKGGKIIHKIRLKQDIVIIFSKYTLNV